MTRIAFVGAGSVVFTKNLLTDILSLPELHGSTVALHDIDAERLETAGLMARWISRELGAGARIEEHLERRAALDGADFVVNAVQVGMREATLIDFDIPRKYGLKQTIGDSLGIGGIFRGLRTIPFMMELGADMSAVCPAGVLLNYTNPMSMLMWSFYEAHPDIESIGLCHSVQYTSRQIASYVGVDYDRLVYECSGINHIAWMTRLEVDGEDVYPHLRAVMAHPAVYAKDKVRFELMSNLGYFVTESSEHIAEYTPYFLRDQSLIDEYDIPVDEYVRRSEDNLRSYQESRCRLLSSEPFTLEPSVEYGASIIHSLITGTPRMIYGNVPNTGLIDNFPDQCCVEVPVLVHRSGFSPRRTGRLPPQLAAMCNPHIAVQELVVRAARDGNRDHVYHAAMLDRHAPSVLSLEAIRAMVDELIDAHHDALPYGVRRQR